MRGDELLELETRRRIYDHVAAHPGTHMRELQRQLGMSSGTIEYHLRALVKAGLLSKRRTTRHARFFVASEVSRQEKDVLGPLRQEIPRRICTHLLVDPEQSHGELLRHFSVAPSTLSFHLKGLLEAGILTSRRAGRETRYRVVDPDLVAKCLVDYRESFLDDVVDRFAGVWLDLGGGLDGPSDEGPEADDADSRSSDDPESGLQAAPWEVPHASEDQGAQPQGGAARNRTPGTQIAKSGAGLEPADPVD